MTGRRERLWGMIACMGVGNLVLAALLLLLVVIPFVRRQREQAFRDS